MKMKRMFEIKEFLVVSFAVVFLFSVSSNGGECPASSENNPMADPKKNGTDGKVWIDEIAQFVDAKTENIKEFNSYSCQFNLPQGSHGYWLAVKNYLDEFDQQKPLPVTEKLEMKTFAAKGEYEPLSFVIYSQQKMTNVKIEATALKRADGADFISADNISVKYGMRVKQCRRYSYPVDDYIVTTRFLRNIKDMNIGQNEFREIYLSIKVPENARAGKYYGKIKVESENLPQSEIGLELEVLPFSLLDPPDKKWGIYYRFSSDCSPTQEKRLAELADLKAHNIQFIVCYGFCMGYKKEKNGAVSAVSTDIEKILNILRQNGFKGTAVFNTGLSRAAKMFYPLSNEKELSDAAMAIPDNEEFMLMARKGGERFRELQKAFPEIEIVLTTSDEVFNVGRLPFYIALTKASKQVPGFKYFITFHSLAGRVPSTDQLRKEIAPYVDYRCHHFYSWEWWLARGNSMDDYRKELAQYGSKAGAYYNPVGPYINPESYRIVMGLAFWISPFSFQCPWAYYGYLKPEADPFDYEATKGSHIFGFYSEKDKALVSTRIWEGYREGMDDLRYIYTLESRIREKTAEKPELAKAASEYLESVRKMLPEPGGLPHDDTKLIGTKMECPWTDAIADKLSFEDYQNIRRTLAEYIIKLDGTGSN